jgi:hypothetical protein
LKVWIRIIQVVVSISPRWFKYKTPVSEGLFLLLPLFLISIIATNRLLQKPLAVLSVYLENQEKPLYFSFRG